jgi:hypothetical protein
LASSNDVGISVLGSVNGGTGYNSYTNGQLLIGNTAGSLARATLTQTPNQVLVTNGDGIITLSTPQDINTTSSVTFGNITDGGLSINSAVYTDGSKLLTTTAPGTGTIGFWDRTGTVLSPLNVGDAITTSGNIYTTGSGAITSSDLLTGSKGLLVSGGDVNLNNSLAFSSNINTGTSTGAVNIGNGTVGGNVISIGNTVSTTGIVERVGTGNYSLDGVGASNYTLGASTVGGAISIGGTSQTGSITLGSSNSNQTVNIGTGAGANAVNIATGGTGNVVIGNTTGTVNMPKLTASRPVKTDGSSNLISTTINLASSNDVGIRIRFS